MSPEIAWKPAVREWANRAAKSLKISRFPRVSSLKRFGSTPWWMLPQARHRENKKSNFFLHIHLVFNPLHPGNSVKSLDLAHVRFKWCRPTGENTPDNKKNNRLRMLLILHSTILAFSSLRESSPIWACLARTSERRAEGLRRSLARSRETRFPRPHKRACSPARLFPALVENGVLVRKGLPAKSEKPLQLKWNMRVKHLNNSETAC